MIMQSQVVSSRTNSLLCKRATPQYSPVPDPVIFKYPQKEYCSNSRHDEILIDWSLDNYEKIVSKLKLKINIFQI